MAAERAPLRAASHKITATVLGAGRLRRVCKSSEEAAVYQGKSKKKSTTKMSYAVLVDSVLFVNQVFDEHIDCGL